MNEVSDWKISKWPFLAANVALLAAAVGVVYKAPHPISHVEIYIAAVCKA